MINNRAEDSGGAVGRETMLAHVRTQGIKDERVLAAMANVPRHRFVPEAYRGKDDPYGDHPCTIGFGQTISQPFVVAYMTGRMQIRPGDKVLEIGSGSGYQSAILAELGARVFTIECIPELAEHARATLAAEGYGSVAVRRGDGYRGWPEEAPFDVILVTCAPESIPTALTAQLRDGGRMIAPVGAGRQQLILLYRRGGRIEEELDLSVRFVPMVHGGEERHGGVS